MLCEPKPRFTPRCIDATSRKTTQCSALRKIKSKSPSSPSTAYLSPIGANTSGSSLSSINKQRGCEHSVKLKIFQFLLYFCSSVHFLHVFRMFVIPLIVIFPKVKNPRELTDRGKKIDRTNTDQTCNKP